MLINGVHVKAFHRLLVIKEVRALDRLTVVDDFLTGWNHHRFDLSLAKSFDFDFFW